MELCLEEVQSGALPHEADSCLATRILGLYIGRLPTTSFKALSIVVGKDIPATGPQAYLLNILAGRGSLQQLSVLSLVDASEGRGEAPMLDLLAAPSKVAKVSS
jgi:hypothetical protein